MIVSNRCFCFAISPTQTPTPNCCGHCIESWSLVLKLAWQFLFLNEYTSWVVIDCVIIGNLSSTNLEFAVWLCRCYHPLFGSLYVTKLCHFCICYKFNSHFAKTRHCLCIVKRIIQKNV